ncbi:DUF4430 domain-containing protein [Isoptericola sp. 178]|uniref:DUF4430 domain-containing protein n=1 Tax=Isoptericola sp. 178 TaxID=3064651 RepID=UPI002712CBE7|nr:DUF4430 domain-containing protein [Isoptericola sp. 178]MDO8145186.1 DUF4430 domain-containing protein [Isoptericola sp. 178]
MRIPKRTTPDRLLSAAAVGALAVGLLAGCGQDDDPAATPVDTSASVSAPQDTAEESAEQDVTEFSYTGEDGRTALELLLEADPEAEVTGEGEMAYVTGIQGRTAVEGEEFWSLSVDGEMAQVGAGALETEDGQEITWTLEEITE